MVKIRKLVLIRYMPLNEFIYDQFYLGDVVAQGIELEYWDISKMFFDDMSYLESSNALCKTTAIGTYSGFIEKIKCEDNETTLYFPMMTVEGRVYELYRIFTRFRCKLLMYGRNVFPFPPMNNHQRSFVTKLSRITLKNVKRKMDAILLRRGINSGKIIPFEIVCLGGEYGWTGIGTHTPESLKGASIIIKLNCDDYDIVKMIKKTVPNRLIDGSYILFLDEYLPLHPDTVMFNIKNVDPGFYYKQINSYFDKVEKQFGMPVVVAAHPKAIKYKDNDYFNSRRVLFGESALLSRDAEFVIAHDSTSVNYAICFSKPLHLITSSDIEKTINSVHIDVLHFSKIIGCNWQYMDRLDTEIDIAPVNAQKYESYKYNYQTWVETENMLSKDIFIDWLKQNS